MFYFVYTIVESEINRYLKLPWVINCNFKQFFYR